MSAAQIMAKLFIWWAFSALSMFGWLPWQRRKDPCTSLPRTMHTVPARTDRKLLPAAVAALPE